MKTPARGNNTTDAMKQVDFQSKEKLEQKNRLGICNTWYTKHLHAKYDSLISKCNIYINVLVVVIQLSIYLPQPFIFFSN